MESDALSLILLSLFLWCQDA